MTTTKSNYQSATTLQDNKTGRTGSLRHKISKRDKTGWAGSLRGRIGRISKINWIESFLIFFFLILPKFSILFILPILPRSDPAHPVFIVLGSCTILPILFCLFCLSCDERAFQVPFYKWTSFTACFKMQAEIMMKLISSLDHL